MEKVLVTVEKYILYIALGLFTVFVLSGYSSPYIIPKLILLVGGIGLMILVWVAKIVTKGTVTFFLGKFDMGVLLLGLAYLLSTILASPNKMEAYLLPGTTTFVLAGVMLYFLINQFSQKVKADALIALFVSSLALALVSLVASLNFFSKVPQLPEFMKDPSFNPLGGVIPTIVILAVTSVFSVSIFIKEKEMIRKFFYGVGMAVIFFALILLISSTLPGKPTTPRLLPMQVSWEVAVDSVKKSPLLGVGPANYLTAFNLFRPVTYNQTDLWQVRFTTASNLIFTVMTEVGFFGLYALGVLLAALYKYIKSDLRLTGGRENLIPLFEKLSVVLLIALCFLLPIAPVVMVFMFAMLAIISKSEHKTVHLNVAGADTTSVASKVPAFIVGLPFVVGVVTLFSFSSRILAAEKTFTQSLNAVANNDAKSTYTLMNAAINQNPRVDRYHASFAQVNMALASSLASKKTITDNDRSAISKLVQQAISEGKATVTLNPLRSGNWEVLAQIYRTIMPYAQGAEQFTIQTYSQAIALDPTSPNLRLALGGVYYSLGNFDSAIDNFKLAVLAKSNFPNAHYNLAIAYREKKDFTNAITEINAVITLVPKDSEDYKLAQQTLTDLQAKKTAAKEATSGTENLTPPQPVEKSNIKPPLELPKEATPPAATP